MIKWIEENVAAVTFAFCLLFAIEAGYWCVNMPRAFRSEMVPKIDYIAGFEDRQTIHRETMYQELDRMNTRLNEYHARLDFYMDVERNRLLRSH